MKYIKHLYYPIAGVSLLTAGISIGVMLVHHLQQVSFYKNITLPIFSIITGCIAFCAILALITYSATKDSDHNKDVLNKFTHIASMFLIPLTITGAGISAVELYIINYNAPKAIIQSELEQAAYISAIVVVAGIALMAVIYNSLSNSKVEVTAT